MEKIKVGITIGDINGIGPEVIIKTLNQSKILKMCSPIIYANAKIISYHRNVAKSHTFSFKTINDAESTYDKYVNVINCWQENVSISLGKITEEGGKYAIKSLERALEDLKNKKIDALVTGPINKKSMNLVGFPFKGHTDYLEDYFDVENDLMILVNDSLRVAVLSHHIPISEVASTVTKSAIVQSIELLSDTLKTDFGLEKPTIGVLGLNPHASDDGVIGNEEEQIIRPAIVEVKKKGIFAFGPFSPDAYWGSAKYLKYDATLAMYHDQGLIPFKLSSFGNGTNVTAGLPFIRTSPDHGTAYDIAGKNLSNPNSFRAALFTAIDMAKSRKEYYDMKKNQLEKNAKPSEEVVE